MKAESITTRILLAEEDIIQRLLIQEYVEIERRYEVLETDGIQPLLDLCGSRLSRGALILLDMRWSKAGEVDVILEIRKRNPKIPILGMTDHLPGFPEESRLRKLRIGLLHKPFSALRLHRSRTA